MISVLNKTTPLTAQEVEQAEAAADRVEAMRVTACRVCRGLGTHRPMLHVIECMDCQGTGVDISDPISVIKQQQELLKKAKVVIVSQRRNIYALTVGPEQATADAMARFYKNSSIID